MGEEKKEKASKDGGDKKEAAPAAAAQPIVLKVDLHYAGCASKVKLAKKHAPGVESVATDTAANKVVVTGTADAAELKEPKEETVTLKIRLHCDGCIDRIKRRIYKIKGVKNVAVDAAKDLVKVTGTMDAAALPGFLKDKLSRPVEVIAPGKKDGGGGGDKKDGAKKDDGKKDKGAGDGGDKKDGGEEKKDKSAAASASVAPMPLADAGMYQMPPPYGYTPYAPPPGGFYGGAPPPNPAFYPNAGAHYPPPYPYPAHAPQIFSDENPNACSVM